MNGPKHPADGDRFANHRTQLIQLGVSPIVIHLHVSVLKIVHEFWCKYQDFKFQVNGSYLV